MNPDESPLAQRWLNLWRSRAGARPGPGPVLALYHRLRALYTAPDRHYHNLAHIAHCLSELDAARHLARDPGAVEAAIWFHDAIYDPQRTDNVHRSADLASTEFSALRHPLPFIEAVTRLILATRHDRIPDEADARLIADIDLAILGQPPALFDRYECDIRREYAHISEPQYRAGRTDFLNRILARPAIYSTFFFRQRYEAAARSNLLRSLARAQSPP